MDGFSPDGYIIDQDYFGACEYRGIPASRNGCGWIAAYNLRHFLRHDVRFEDVLREMDRMHTLRIPGPTTMPVMRAYLEKHVPGITETIGRDAALEAAVGCRAGILRYSEAGVPHFIFFLRDGEVFRFTNVNDGLEDFTSAMEMFFETHVPQRQYTSVFTI